MLRPERSIEFVVLRSRMLGPHHFLCAWLIPKLDGRVAKRTSVMPRRRLLGISVTPAYGMPRRGLLGMTAFRTRFRISCRKICHLRV
jgi:hypothetical protein